MMGFSYEKRPLKRPRLGPPDVYPQDPKQKEDELTTVNVKHGFTTLPQLADEFGTARNANISASKVGAYFNAILSKKEELNTLPDTGRKRQQINPKDNFWPATARTKNAIEAWFKDLAGSKPLSSLSKKAPNFNKKEEIFTMLCEYQVPMLRAAWFIKLSSAYTVAVSEAKIKKRQLPDPSQEWTQTLIKFLKDQLQKLQEYYHSPPCGNASSNSSGSNSAPPSASPSSSAISTLSSYSINSSLPCEEHAPARRQWQYCIQLAAHLYEEGLLEQQEFLQWILDLLDKVRTPDDGILRLILPLVLCYLDEFVRSELLARKLAHGIARKLARLCADHPTGTSQASPNNSTRCSNGNENHRSGTLACAGSRPNSVSSSMNEYLNCPLHREIVLSLSAIIQAITIDCPTALVWNCVGEGRGPSILDASPLDHLPCPPSMLPLPQRSQGARVRMQIALAEESIRQRSRAAEGRWSCDRWQQSTAGITTAKVLSALDALDRHCFDRVDSSNSLDVLYNKIFSPIGTRENPGDYRPPAADEAVVRTLCEWAVSTRRSGEHRAIAVAALLERRQADLLAAGDEPSTTDGGTQGGGGSGAGGEEGDSASWALSPSFQPLLMNFLDDDAPILDENPSPQNRAMFANLVHLFYELIRHDVFSHDAYMCTLISRGDRLSGVATTPGPPTLAPNRAQRTRRHPSGSGRHPGTPAGDADDDHPVGTPNLFPTVDIVTTKTEDYDDSKIDDDLDKLLQHIKEEQQNSMDAPDSPKDEPPPQPSIPATVSVEESTIVGSEPTRQSRHLLYTTHFPLPQDDSLSNHDSNQRHVLLYGVGRERDDARHIVKKITKEISKLFGKKFSIDIAEGGKVKRHSRGEFSFEGMTQRVHGGLSYFDQHVVTVQCAAVVIEMLAAFGAGNSNYLPVQEHIAFLFDLMEMSLNIYGLIDFCIQILKELPEVEAQLVAKGSPLGRSYTTSLCLYVVGVLRRYHCCLLLSMEQTTSVFEGLCRAVKHVTNPGDCSSAERCVLAHLYDLYSSCAPLKAKPCEPFSNAYPKIRQALYSPVLPSQSNYVCNAQFMAEALNGTGRGGSSLGGSVGVGGTTPVGSATPTGAGGGGATPTSSGGQGSTSNSVNVSTSLPGRRIEAQWLRQLSESAANRYSFVCNTVVAVCSEMDIDRVNELAVLAAELTASCNALSSEWLGVLTALCCSSNHRSFFIDVQAQVDIQDVSIHNSLAVFTSILIARHCFSLEDFVVHVALPSLVRAGNEGRGDADSEAEAGARLACHLLLRLFGTRLHGGPFGSAQALGTSPMPSAINEGYGIKLSCDRHLLAAALKNIRVGAVLAVLKAILVLGDATARDIRCRKGEQSKGSVGSSGSVSGSGELSISHILGTSDILGGGDESQRDIGSIASGTPTGRGSGGPEGGNESAVTLSEFARLVLRRICGREWVLERCLQNPEELCHPEMLLDSMLTPMQAQRLLRMICHPETAEAGDEPPDQRRIVASILENLDQWTLRMSWLDLQLMFRQFSSNSNELSQWLDIVAKAAIDVFQVSGGNDSGREERMLGGKGIEGDMPRSVGGSRGKEEPEVERGRRAVGGGPTNSTTTTSASERRSGHSNGSSNNQRRASSDIGKSNSMWLVAPLVSKLPGAVQGRVLKVAGQVLESGNWCSRGKDRERGSRRGSSFLSHHQPFLSLVLTCLGGQDDQREGLLASLHSQLNQYLVLSKDERLCNSDGLDTRSRVLMQDALRLRFSLVGGMFDTIRRNTTTTTDWAILLVQLVSHGVVDLNNNCELYTTVIDMLSTLIHSTLVSDSQSEKGDENKKHYQNLIKKLKKELGDRASPSLRHIRQLLPLPKRTREVIACEPVGLLTDTKGNKIAGFDSIDKKQGLQVAEKQRVVPWDLLEGHRNPAPLSWAWFGAVRVERRPLWYEDTHRLLRYHTHSLLRSPSHFLDPPPLPVEDPEPPREKPCLCVYCIRPKEEADTGTPDSGHSPNRNTPSGATSMGDIVAGGMGGAGGVSRPPPGMPQSATIVPLKRAKTPRRRRSKAGANAVAPPGQRAQAPLPPPPPQAPHPSAAPSHMRAAGGPPVNTSDASMQQFQQTVGSHMTFDPSRAAYGTQPPPHQWPPPTNVQQQRQVQQQAPQQRQPAQQQQQQQVRQPPQMQRQQPTAQQSVGPQPSQQQYYSQQMAPAPVAGGPRFERPVNQSKQALSNMLRMRHPTAQFLSSQQSAQQPPQPPFQNMQRQQFIRQTLRAQHMPGGMQPPQAQQQQQQNQFSAQGPGAQPPMYSSISQDNLSSHLGMGQNYGGYMSGAGGVPQQMMVRQGASGGNQQPNPQQAMAHTFTQSGYVRLQRPPQQGGGGGGSVGGGMQGDGSGAGGYVGGGGPTGAPQVQHSNTGMTPGMRPQFVQAPNVTMGAPGSGNQGGVPCTQGTGGGGGVVGSQYGRSMQQSGGPQQGTPPPQQQFQQAVRLRQQMMAMQQQQQQGGAGGGSGAAPALVAHLQRQLNGANPGNQPGQMGAGGAGQGPQGHYHHRPPPY